MRLELQLRKPAKTNLLKLLLLIIISASIMNCTSTIPYTDSVKKEYSLTPSDIKNIQFQLSHTLVLRRELSESEKEVTTSHTLKSFEGKEVEEIVFPAKTPGIVTNVQPLLLEVSFEPGKVLTFQYSARDRRPRYYLASENDKWNSENKGRPIVTYGNQKYEISENIEGLSNNYAIVMGPLTFFMALIFGADEEASFAPILTLTGLGVTIYALATTNWAQFNSKGNKLNSAWNIHLEVKEGNLKRKKVDSRAVQGMKL